MRTLVEVKTADLIGPALDWVAAKAAEYEPSVYRADGLDGSVSYDIGLPTMSVKKPYTRWSPSADLDQSGHLLDRGFISTIYEPADDPVAPGQWRAFFRADGPEFRHESRMVAGLRAYVQASLGDVVQVPAELLEVAHDGRE